MAKREKRHGGNPMRSGILLSILLGALSLLLTAGLGAILILKGVLPESAEPVLAAAAILLAAFLGPLPLIRAVGGKRLPCAYACAAVLLLAAVLIRWSFWATRPFGSWYVFAAAFAGATLAGLIAGRPKKRRV